MVKKPTGRSAIRSVLLHIHDNPDGKILLPCTLGKDRTGIVFGLLLALADVPDNVIAQEFALSEPVSRL